MLYCTAGWIKRKIYDTITYIHQIVDSYIMFGGGGWHWWKKNSGLSINKNLLILEDIYIKDCIFYTCNACLFRTIYVRNRKRTHVKGYKSLCCKEKKNIFLIVKMWKCYKGRVCRYDVRVFLILVFLIFPLFFLNREKEIYTQF